MKKLLMFAAAMTIVGGAYAGPCFDGPDSISAPCDIPVWDFKASGKTANEVKGGYKSVQKVSFTGAIAGVLDEETCCVVGFDLYIYDKAYKSLYLFEEMPVEKMSVFGKNLRKVLKPGKSTAVESDVLWIWDGDTEDGDIDLTFVGFGKGKRYMSKDSPNTDPCGDNSIEGCEESFDWPSWNGWFAGWFLDDNNDFEILNCEGEDPCVAVAGGTWSAKFNKKLSGSANPGAAIASKFKAVLVDYVD